MFNRKSQTFTSFTYDKDDPSSLGADAVLSILEDKHHNFWIGTWAGGLNLMNFHDSSISKQSVSFTRFQKNIKEPYSIGSDNIWKVFEDNEGRIWLATFESGIYQWMPSKFKDTDTGFRDYRAIKYTTSRNLVDFHSLSILDIEQDEAGLIWLGTIQGIIYFNPKDIPLYYEDLGSKGKEIHFENYRPSNTSSFDLPSDLIRDIYMGTNHTIWISTNIGVTTYLSKRKFSPTYPDFGKFVEPDVCSFEEKNDSIIWLGTRIGGLFEYNTHTGISERIENPSLNFGDYDLNKITTLYKEGQNLWIGNGYGISKMHIPSQRFTDYHLKNNKGEALKGTLVRSFYRDSTTGILWAGSQNGLIQIRGKKSKVYHPDPHDSVSIPDKIVMDILKDDEGNLWLATSGEGMCELNWNQKEKRYTFKNYRIDQSGLENISSIINSAVKFNNFFLIGTTNGILIFDPVSKTYFRNGELVPEIQGYVNSIVVDQANHLWISMDKGLLGFFPESKRLASFNIIDGLPGEAIEYRSSYMNDKGIIFLGGMEGFCSFPGHLFPTENTANKVYITDLQIYGESVKVGQEDPFLRKSILQKHISNTDAISLSYQHKAIGLEFAMLDYVQNVKNTYFYKLDGFDDEWRELKGRNSVIWSHL
ncbi:MAG: two-component regulator propeller domain-containing protein, partial [Bacteroidota bacterium]